MIVLSPTAIVLIPSFLHCLLEPISAAGYLFHWSIMTSSETEVALARLTGDCPPKYSTYPASRRRDFYEYYLGTLPIFMLAQSYALEAPKAFTQVGFTPSDESGVVFIVTANRGSETCNLNSSRCDCDAQSRGMLRVVPSNTSYLDFLRKFHRFPSIPSVVKIARVLPMPPRPHKPF